MSWPVPRSVRTAGFCCSTTQSPGITYAATGPWEHVALQGSRGAPPPDRTVGAPPGEFRAAHQHLEPALRAHDAVPSDNEPPSVDSALLPDTRGAGRLRSVVVPVARDPRADQLSRFRTSEPGCPRIEVGRTDLPVGTNLVQDMPKGRRVSTQ